MSLFFKLSLWFNPLLENMFQVPGQQVQGNESPKDPLDRSPPETFQTDSRTTQITTCGSIRARLQGLVGWLDRIVRDVVPSFVLLELQLHPGPWMGLVSTCFHHLRTKSHMMPDRVKHRVEPKQKHLELQRGAHRRSTCFV